MGFNKYYLVLAVCYFMGQLLTKVHSYPRSNPNQDFVDAHSATQAEVGVGPITWNWTVVAYAQNYANQKIENCKMEHSGGPYGKNLVEGNGSMTGEEAVKFWVTKKLEKDYRTNSCVGDESLYYTQVVWRKSVHLGCARVKCHNGWMYSWMFVICNYDPPGNYDGERPY
ncbi:basic form of pathogenesis-related protein 1-like [Ziziphus jujuba]|uniref:Basic form of pathogenesis-related protein 1-like n=1 Tax=Ziziphus jujuba TaxID=326968 RepID=A0ABM3ZRT6_ZIZJJ|nr:basic form of pathogenesis-related protein 1-like [Ziziphus jujuba]